MLFKRAVAAREGAYAPYSKLRVGCAVQAESGEIFSGANVENASFGGTICAERAALIAAVNAGHKNFSHIVVVAELDGRAIPPCGICLQFISEFCDPFTKICIGTPAGIKSSYTLKDLLPIQFKFLDSK